MLKNQRRYAFFQAICAIMPSLKGFGFKNRSFGRFFWANKPQNLLAPAAARVAASSRLKKLLGKGVRHEKTLSYFIFGYILGRPYQHCFCSRFP
jgi:hypothetical protein